MYHCISIDQVLLSSMLTTRPVRSREHKYLRCLITADCQRSADAAIMDDAVRAPHLRRLPPFRQQIWSIVPRLPVVLGMRTAY